MKKHLLSMFAVAALCAAGTSTALADDETWGRSTTIDASNKITAYTYVTDAGSVCSVSKWDGSQTKDTNNKKCKFKTTEYDNTGVEANRTKISSSAIGSSRNDNAYTGFKLSIPAGYKIVVSSIKAKVAVNADMTYQVELSDGETEVYYTSQEKAISNYNKSTASNLEPTITPSPTLELTGDVYCKLYYWLNSDSKYLIPLDLNIQGQLEVATKTAWDKPSVTVGDYDQPSGKYAVTLLAEEGASVKYTIDGTTTTVASGTVINVAPGKTISAVATDDAATYADSDAREVVVKDAPKVATPSITVGGYDFAAARYTVTLSGTGTLYYKIGDGVATAYTEPLAVAPLATVTAYATQTNMTNSDNAVKTMAAAPADGSDAWTAASVESSQTYEGTAFTVASAYVAGTIQSGTTDLNRSLKMRTNSTFTAATSHNGFALTVRPGFMVTSVTVRAYTNDTTVMTIAGVYADNSDDNLLATPVPCPTYATNGSYGSLTVEPNATRQIGFETTGGQKQMQVEIDVTYKVSEYVNITSAGFATAYYEKELVIPAGVKAYTATVDADVVTLHELTGVIPARTAVVVEGTASVFEVGTTGASPVAGNALVGTVESGVTAASLKGAGSIYALAQKTVGSDDVVGFFPFTGTNVTAHKAYLVVPSGAAPVLRLRFDTEEANTTALHTVAVETFGEAPAYDLLGRRTSSAVKGLQVKGGKLIMVK